MSSPNAVAVFCGSSPGNQPAFTHAAESLGHAIAKAGKGLIYGGGAKGIMGTVSGAALEGGAKVTGVVPYAMVKDGAEIGPTDRGTDNVNGAKHEDTNWVMLKERGREKVETVVVRSMHERKVEMAKRVSGFFGLPGGYGTFEELFEVITWTQIEIHNKPVVLLNVLGYYNPLRELIRSGIRTGFIQPQNEGLVVFIDGPSDISEHETYDWGLDALNAMENWKRPEWNGYGFDWTKKLGDEQGTRPSLDAT